MPVVKIFGLQGPALMVNSFGLNPGRFNPPEVTALHHRVERNCAAAFREIGGPELRPIIPTVLSKQEFIAECCQASQQSMSEAEAADVDSFCLNRYSEGIEIGWQLYYNLDYLKRAPRQMGISVSNLIVRQITSTLYSPWLEKTAAEDTLSLQTLRSIGLGWGVYFSHAPATPQQLLAIEQQAALRKDEPKMVNMIRSFFSDKRFFVSCALFKLEIAEGFEAVVDLMNRPPGLQENNGSCLVHNTMDEFWRIYLEANIKLGMPALDRKTVDGLTEN
jgi:hypothetical protein